MSGAKERIWLSTTYLTDGEIVSALYLARYRKLNVMVLLGQTKANAYLSRLNYLKNQKIPVFLMPRDYQPRSASSVLVDNKVMHIDGELDFKADYREFSAVTETGAKANVYAAEFSKAAANKVPAVARPRPAVGKRHSGTNWGRAYKPGQTQPTYRPGRLPKPRQVVRGDPNDAGYFGGGAPKARPQDMPKALPKVPVWQQRLNNEEQPDNAPIQSGADEATESRQGG